MPPVHKRMPVLPHEDDVEVWPHGSLEDVMGTGAAFLTSGRTHANLRFVVRAQDRDFALADSFDRRCIHDRFGDDFSGRVVDHVA